MPDIKQNEIYEGGNSLGLSVWDIYQTAHKMFDKEIVDYFWDKETVTGTQRLSINHIEKIKSFIDQIIDLAKAEARAERDKEIVERMYKFIRSGEFSGSFAEGCDCQECDKYEIKSKKKFINFITNQN